MTARMLYIGGFGEPKATEAVCSASLAAFNREEIDTLTLPEAMRRPGLVRCMAKDALVLSHSAGWLSARWLDGAEAIVGVTPPLRRPPHRLVAGALHEAWNMYAIGDESPHARLAQAVRCQSALATEMALHAPNHVRFLSKIAQTDAISDAAKLSGPPVTLVFMEQDPLFDPTDGELEVITDASHVTVARVKGRHDELLISPETCLPIVAGACVRDSSSL